MRESERACIIHAPNSLQSFACDWDVTDLLHLPDFQDRLPPPIKRLTALTRLELFWCNSITSPNLMRDLPLRELLLHSCLLSTYTNLSSLFITGALPLLQKLHLEEDQTPLPDCVDDDLETYPDPAIKEGLVREREEASLSARRGEAMAYSESLQTLADGLLDLPWLQQVSGRSALFDLRMEDELENWHMSRGADWSLLEFNTANFKRAPGLKIWSKARH